MALKNLQSLVQSVATTQSARMAGGIVRGFSGTLADGRAMFLSLPRHWSPKPADLDPENPMGRQRRYGATVAGAGRSPRFASARASSRLTCVVRGLWQERTTNQTPTKTALGSPLRSMPARMHG